MAGSKPCVCPDPLRLADAYCPLHGHDAVLATPAGVSPRKWAIDTLTAALDHEIGEFCVTDAERERSFAEYRAALNTIGVADEEIEWGS